MHHPAARSRRNTYHASGPEGCGACAEPSHGGRGRAGARGDVVYDSCFVFDSDAPAPPPSPPPSPPEDEGSRRRGMGLQPREMLLRRAGGLCSEPGRRWVRNQPGRRWLRNQPGRRWLRNNRDGDGFATTRADDNAWDDDSEAGFATERGADGFATNREDSGFATDRGFATNQEAGFTTEREGSSRSPSRARRSNPRIGARSNLMPTIGEQTLSLDLSGGLDSTMTRPALLQAMHPESSRPTLRGASRRSSRPRDLPPHMLNGGSGVAFSATAPVLVRAETPPAVQTSLDVERNLAGRAYVRLRLCINSTGPATVKLALSVTPTQNPSVRASLEASPKE